MSTSYTNTGGTGVRGTFVLATFPTAGAVASKWIQFDFSHAVVVDEALSWW